MSDDSARSDTFTRRSATVTTSVPWSIDVPPATGSNSIVVTAYDLSGNSTALTRSFTFTQRTLLTLARTAPSGIALDAAGTVALAVSPAT
ncbi:MAG: hypothetical protein EBS42_08795, partial [Caulobacteraceae bacterium]|nr:hypothetical protein [Caulobacteraceae bacterium]